MLRNMPHRLTWVDYLNRLPGSPSHRDIARAAGTNPSTVSRWHSGQMPAPGHVVDVARAFNLHPASALMNAGYLTIDEVDALADGDAQVEVMTLSDFTTEELLEEIRKRIVRIENGD